MLVFFAVRSVVVLGGGINAANLRTLSKSQIWYSVSKACRLVAFRLFENLRRLVLTPEDELNIFVTSSRSTRNVHCDS